MSMIQVDEDKLKEIVKALGSFFSNYCIHGKNGCDNRTVPCEECIWDYVIKQDKENN